MALNRKDQLKELNKLHKSTYWNVGLKPVLESIRAGVAGNTREHKTEFDAMRAELQRVNTIKIIDSIINRVEEAGDRLAGIKD